jgi:TPR repeat protein
MKKIVLAFAFIGSLLVASDFSEAVNKLDVGSEKEAVEALSILAKNGNVDSQTLLGEIYLDGIGTEVNFEKAFFWLSKAAKSDVEAKYLLGFMYENGLYVKQDNLKALSFYEASAKNGGLLAQFNVAMMYKEGKGGIKKDMNKAMMWLEKASLSKNSTNYLSAR